MESLGSKLQQARLARGLTLDEAGRLTKIRPGKIAEMEAEDFSSFPSLTYAKGFLQIYGKFLDVDVTPYLEAFETPDAVTVDGYQYLQDAPEPPPPPRRPTVVRRKEPREGTSLWPFVIGVIVLIGGFIALRTFMNLQRLKPHDTRAASPPPAATAANIVAPRALPADSPAVAAAQPTATAAASIAMANPSPAAANPQAAIAAQTPAPAPAQTATPTNSEPEVRRAEPVRAQDEQAAASPAAKTINKIEIKPLKKTYIRVVVDNKSDSPAIERWISSSDKLLRVSGQHANIRVLDRTAVEIRKNGKAVADDDPDVTIE